MKENKVEVKEPNAPQAQKLTYEQLENVASQLSEQSRQLYQKLQEANLVNMFKRLDYLFKVVENSNHFNAEFVTSCIEEIENMMTLEKEENVTEEEKKQ